jgi:hypothetical protein
MRSFPDPTMATWSGPGERHDPFWNSPVRQTDFGAVETAKSIRASNRAAVGSACHECRWCSPAAIPWGIGIVPLLAFQYCLARRGLNVTPGDPHRNVSRVDSGLTKKSTQLAAISSVMRTRKLNNRGTEDDRE